MVKNADKMRARLRAAPLRLRKAAAIALQKQAERIIRQMKMFKPLEEIEIEWAWGDAPAGALSLATVQGDSTLRITIYATARTFDYPGGFPALARWHEFGTAERVQKTTGRYSGRIAANPFFFPVWRARRKAARQAVRRAIAKAWKEA